ncbi:hypothetical protein TSOC_010852 [Tetrabaena socialis]|uniref:Uncharacterized protein n=1 Tax=Tetrabaena socialis TaxID=47790 RepID=A0A2J7ZS65_9CHLO|nr:hypothetical protein TSOC_010852 [Tetrabaena socialis]|eukprot:PNH03114.1 hypothetical protein TSOC_010852 [Tetrabaena socialis]
MQLRHGQHPQQLAPGGHQSAPRRVSQHASRFRESSMQVNRLASMLGGSSAVEAQLSSGGGLQGAVSPHSLPSVTLPITTVGILPLPGRKARDSYAALPGMI